MKQTEPATEAMDGLPRNHQNELLFEIKASVAQHERNLMRTGASMCGPSNYLLFINRRRS